MHYYATQNRQFESDILTIGCLAGVLRMVIAVYRDLPLVDIDLDFIVDCSLLMVFLVPLILMRLEVKFEWITVPFSFLVLAFLCANWIVLDGLDGTGEYYYLGGIIIIALIHHGSWLVFFVALSIVLEIGLLFVWLNPPDWMNFVNPQSAESSHYLWVSIIATIALLYHKSQFDLKSLSLKQKREALQDKVQRLERQNVQLQEQKEMLQKSNELLESNINKRSEKLLNQRESIEKYLSVTLFEIKPYLENTLNSIKGLDNDTKKSQIGSLLMLSIDHLQSAIDQVTHKIKKRIYYNPEN